MFQPSPLQLQAIASMEAQLGIRRGRQHFADGAAFDAYFKTLQQRCQRQGSEDPAARRQRREARLANYYQDHERLRQYALRYNLRYQPSSPALLTALLRKCPDEERCQAVMTAMAEHLDDQGRAQELAMSLHQRGHHRQGVRQRLLRRRFPSQAIEHALAALDEHSGEAPLDDDALQRRLAQLRRRGMSSSAIVGRLASTPDEREQLRQTMTDASANDQRAALELCRKLLRQGIEPRRIQQRLARRGFSAATCTAALAQAQEEAQ
ncbi:MAG: hypothetical protein EA401_12060 [Planctomycetota bacterium]|nr:MAG: hypothetical protein EA401_12060 [Planctomycetota bacterium]